MNIIVNNNKCKINTTLKKHHKLREKFKVKSPGAFFTQAFRSRRWDGYIRYVTEAGYFDTGLLPQVLELVKEVELEDDRVILKPKKIPKEIQGKVLRPYQRKGVKAILKNEVGGLPFPRGIINAATNAGKNLMMAAILKSYPKEAKGIILMKEQEWYDTTLGELQELLPGEVGYLNSKGEEWNRFMVVMAPTIYSRIDRFKNKLAQFDIVFVDECEMCTNKTFSTILKYLFNAYCRVGLSGTALLSTLKKDLPKNNDLKRYFGEKVFEISNQDLIELGHSTPPFVSINTGNTHIKIAGDYEAEYDRGIVKNKKRNTRIIDRVLYHTKKERFPMLIIAKRHKHLRILYKRISASLSDYHIKMVHHETKDRKQIVKDFTEGKIDILVGSFILKRAKNFPSLKVIINVAGVDSHEDVLQIVGRALRTHESKKVVFIEDFYDIGSYLNRHSNHRVKYYKKQGFKVKENYKK